MIKLKDYDELYTAKIQKILRRTILLFPLLVNEETGGIIAALEVDEKKIYVVDMHIVGQEMLLLFPKH
ncbi:MAG: hypothetical protein ACLS9A_07540 [Clostridia bacterium]